MHQNGFDGYLFFNFLVVAGIKVEKERSLELGKTWFGRRFCCLVIYANLRNLPCILFFTFLVILGNRVEKKKLRTWQNMIWKAFLLVIMPIFTVLPCICIKMAPTGTFFTFLVIAGLKGEKECLEHGKTWFGKLYCRLLIYSNLHSLPCICIKFVPTGAFFTFLVIRTWQSMV